MSVSRGRIIAMLRLFPILLVLLNVLLFNPSASYAFSFLHPVTVGFIAEPTQGYRELLNAINNAHSRIIMTMYELRDPQIVDAMIQAHNRGVRVQVILDQAFHGGEVNQASYAQLSAAGVQVHWAPENTIYHEKSFTIDNTEAYIGTGNLDDKFYMSSIDAWSYINDPGVISAITQTFDNDMQAARGTGATVQSPYLIWSPYAKAAFLNDIQSAHRSIDIMAEELKDPDITAAIADVARRGVTCRILMTYDPSWQANLSRIENAGCTAVLYPDNSRTLYVHEKMILVDGDDVILGSQNLSTSSLIRNRELSLHLHIGPNASINDFISRATQEFNQDFNRTA